MNRSLAILSSAALFAAAANAQCFSATGTSTTMNPDSTAIASGYSVFDEGYSDELPLGFSVMVGGNTYTHVIIDSNSEIYLTDGTAGTGAGTYEANVEANIAPSNFGTGSLAALRGGATGTARIVVHGGDCEGPNATSDILVDASVPGQFKVTWVDWSEYAAGDSWDMSCTIFSTGDIQLDYTDGFNPTSGDYTGVSAGFDVGTGSETASDLSAGGDSGTLALVFENWSNPFDLENSSLTFAANGTGGYAYVISCQLTPASHTPFGSGCYTLGGDSVYEVFPDSPTAATAMDGNGVAFTLNGNAYDVSFVPGAGAAFVAPTAAATVLSLTDDGNTVITPSMMIPTSAGMATDWTVSSNGILNANSSANNAFDWTPTGGEMTGAAAPNVGFYVWRDYNPTEAGSGPIVAEEVGNMLYVTWDAVEAYGSPSPNTATFQFQIDMTTGDVLLAVVNLETSTSTDDTLIGCTTSAEGPDAGSISLASALPVTVTEGVPAMSMSASPAPVSTVSAGTTVSYAINDIPDANVNSGIFFGVNIISLNGDIPGTDLTSLGMPGCFLHVGALDLTISFMGSSANQISTFDVPAGVPAGQLFYAQAAALVFPGSLPNGQNSFGAVVSNGIESYISTL